MIAKDDPTRAAINNHWQDVLNKLAPGDTAAFYFAGHGVEFGGRSYLLPRDVPNIRPGRDELLRREALSLQEFLADLREKGTRLNLVILDACRNNPFEQIPGRSVGSLRGLGITEPPEGTFIMYSAGTGETALDRLNDRDRDPNSVYTRHLLPLLRTPGLSLTDVAEQVRVSVRQMAATVQHRQTPAYYNQIIGRACLAGGDCRSGLATVPAPAPLAEGERMWLIVKDSSSIPALRQFRQQYGSANPLYDKLAEARIGELEKQRFALATPTDPKLPGCDDVQVAVGTPAEVLCIKAGSGLSFRDCWGSNNDDLCGPEMIVVPAGAVRMGSEAAEQGRRDNEPVPHFVAVQGPFAISRFEATFAEWDACVAAGACSFRPSDQGWGRGRRPVINISWDDVSKEYIPWLSRQTGKFYRLLTAVEWEYAARSGTTTPFSTGPTLTSEQANFNGGYPYGNTRKGIFRQASVEVGSFKPNAFGLYDMHGNVEEWVEDCWGTTCKLPSDTVELLPENLRCGFHVVRGGAWDDPANTVRSAICSVVRSDQRGNERGFRLARQIP